MVVFLSMQFSIAGGLCSSVVDGLFVLRCCLSCYSFHHSAVAAINNKRICFFELWKKLLGNTVVDSENLKKRWNSTVANKSERKSFLFDSNAVISKVIVNFSVLMTFGLASPLVAISVTIDSCMMMILWRVLLGKSFSSTSGTISETKEHFEATVKGASRGLSRGLWTTVWVGGIFWSIFIFDMIGDVYGDEIGGYMVLILLIGLPVLMMVSLSLMDKQCVKSNLLIDVEDSVLELELTATSNPIILSQVSNSVF